MNSDDLLLLHRYPRYTTERYKKLAFYWKVLHKEQYDCLPYAFHQETKEPGDEHIPLRQRRPSIRYNLAKIIVGKSVAMCYSGRSWPQITTEDKDFTQWLIAFYELFNFSAFTCRVATFGSIGSVVPIFRLETMEVDGEQKGVLSFDVWNARDCEPTFGPDGGLETVLLKYLTTCSNLRNMGIDPGREENPNSKWWYRRKLTSQDDIVYAPTKQGDWDDAKIELRPLDNRSLHHDFGFVPAEWVSNLPTDEDDSIDGACTFSEIIDFIIEIDYTLSQCGRGLKYNSDPSLLLKEQISNEEGVPLARTTSKLVEVTKDGDGKLLEMTGNGQKVALEYVKDLRNFALEVVRGSRKDPQRALSHASSGKMAEMLEDDLISLAADIRAMYDRGFIIPFTTKLVLALKLRRLGGEIIKNVSIDTLRSIETARGQWFEPTSTDLSQLQDSLMKAVDACFLHPDAARQITYHSYDRLVPDDVNWDEALELIAERERAKNEWQIELAKANAMASAGIQDENDRAVEQAAKENGAGKTKDANGKPKKKKIAPKPNMKVIQKSIETAFPEMKEGNEGVDSNTRQTGQKPTMSDVLNPNTPM